MRTITQLIFESFIQFILQLRQFFYFQAVQSAAEAQDLDISVVAIVISLSLSVAHGILEVIFLQMEANATRTSFLQYCMICYNGRFNWIPYLDFIIDFYQRGNLGQNEEDLQNEEVVLDYEDISTKFCCAELRVNFKFSAETLQQLVKKMIALPK